VWKRDKSTGTQGKRKRTFGRERSNRQKKSKTEKHITNLRDWNFAQKISKGEGKTASSQ